jgi:5-methylcytosine-specific restriction endonuclease McrA
MATRCNRTTQLEIHHLRRDGGSALDNAQVLCQPCHSKTATYGTPGTSPQPFSEETKKAALARSGNRCECTRDSCHTFSF